MVGSTSSLMTMRFVCNKLSKHDESTSQIFPSTPTLQHEHDNVNDQQRNNEHSNWNFPPKAPTPNIYNYVIPVELIASNDKNGFRAFRKQFSGRFKRLVTRKNEPSTVPAELKSQLKTIYVY